MQETEATEYEAHVERIKHELDAAIMRLEVARDNASLDDGGWKRAYQLNDARGYLLKARSLLGGGPN